MTNSNSSPPNATRVSGNDNCQDAVSFKDLPVSYAGSTVNATPDFTSELEPLCGTSLGSKGVWFSFESAKRRIVRIEYELKIYGIGDSILSIFTGPCDIGSIKCEGFAYGLADTVEWNGISANGLAVHEFLSEVGQSYRFLLSGANGDATGEYDLRVMEYDLPSNDACSAAANVITAPGVTQPFSSTTLGATPDFIDTNVKFCACPGMNWYTRGVWYQLTGKGTSIRLEYQLYSYGIGNSELSIFTGSCGSLVCINNVEGLVDTVEWNGISANGLAVHEFYAESDTIYYFLLYGANFGVASNYDFDVTFKQ
jgi:hypothetical protein